MLKVLAIALGVLIVASRLVGVIFPAFIRKLLKVMLEEAGALLLLLVYGALLGGLLIWGFRLEYANAAVGWQAYVLLMLGVLIALVMLLFLAAPKVAMAFMGKFAEMSDANMRLLCLAGVVVGVLIILLGASMGVATTVAYSCS